MKLIAQGMSPSDRASRELTVTFAADMVSVHIGPPGETDNGWTIVLRTEDAHRLFAALAVITEHHASR